MKRIIASALLPVLCVAISFAQIPFTGTWMIKKTMMGTTVAGYLSFDNDTQGRATNKVVIDLKINILGVKAAGKAELSVDGTFVTKDDKLTIRWNKDSFSSTVTPVEMTYKGKASSDRKEKLEKMFDEIVKEMKADIEKNAVDEYYNVSVKGDKLSLTSLNEKGKPETEKFTRSE